MAKAAILIVENEAIIAKDIQCSLAALGYGIAGTAKTADEAFQIVTEMHPDLVLMDVRLNGKRDGINAAEQIRDCADVPIIFLTAYADKKTLARAKSTEPYGYLLKPFGDKELHIAIEIAIHKHQRTKEVVRASEHLFRDMNRRLVKLMTIRDELIGRVSHELRTPLTAIQEGVSLILDRALGDTTALQQDFLKTMEGDANRLAEVIDKMLDISEMTAARMWMRRQRANIQPLIASVVQRHQPLAGRRTLSTEPMEVPAVFVDVERMRQVFSSLLSNAIKFTDERGTIVFRGEQRDDMVAISLQDDGAGIAEEDLPKLFRKFSQVGTYDPNHPCGTGLGLVLCEELVELHKGRIEVSSMAGRGTTFTVLLPIYTDAFALAESMQDLRNRAVVEGVGGQRVRLIAIDAVPSADGEDRIQQQEFQRLVDEISHEMHRDDIILALSATWVVILTMMDGEGLQVIIRRLLRRYGNGARLRIATALYSDHGTDAAALFEYARGMLDQDHHKL